jgi:hypothetical protein
MVDVIPFTVQLHICESLLEKPTVIEPCIGYEFPITVDVIAFTIHHDTCEPIMEIITPVEPYIRQDVTIAVDIIPFAIQFDPCEPIMEIIAPVKHVLWAFTCYKALLGLLYGREKIIFGFSHIVIPPFLLVLW